MGRREDAVPRGRIRDRLEIGTPPPCERYSWQAVNAELFSPADTIRIDRAEMNAWFNEAGTHLTDPADIDTTNHVVWHMLNQSIDTDPPITDPGGTDPSCSYGLSVCPNPPVDPGSGGGGSLARPGR